MPTTTTRSEPDSEVNAGELYNTIGNVTSPDFEVYLEIGGDGAVHTDRLRLISVDTLRGRVTLSSERP